MNINIFNNIFNKEILKNKIENSNLSKTKKQRLVRKLNKTKTFEYLIHKNKRKINEIFFQYTKRFKNIVNIRENFSSFINFNSIKNNVTYSEENFRYAGRKKYFGIHQNIYFNLNYNNVKNIIDENILSPDDIFTVNIISKRIINDIVIYHIEYIKNLKNKQFKIEKCYLAKYVVPHENIFDIYTYKATTLYYHAETLKKAYKNIKNKLIKRDEKSKTSLTLDTKITKTLYHELTGACFLGIDNFCRTYLPDRKSIILKDLLPVLKGQFGYNKILSLLK